MAPRRRRGGSPAAGYRGVGIRGGCRDSFLWLCWRARAHLSLSLSLSLSVSLSLCLSLSLSVSFSVSFSLVLPLVLSLSLSLQPCKRSATIPMLREQEASYVRTSACCLLRLVATRLDSRPPIPMHFSRCGLRRRSARTSMSTHVVGRRRPSSTPQHARAHTLTRTQGGSAPAGDDPAS